MSSPDTLQILIATDIHLGHKQQDPILGTDSFDAFSEVLEHSRCIRPDLLLLGGDLFDKVNPSLTTLYNCLKEIKSVVLDETEGDDSIEMEVKGLEPNYMNRNLNVRLPIFTVHGNHDFPQSMDGRSVCDLLHQSSLVNYIGKYLNFDKVHVKPVFFSKGQTKVALYAIGYINTFRMGKLFKTKNISFEQPPSDTFNIMLLHQNRYKGKQPGADYQNCTHPDQLPKWINLLIWCHQHESIPKITIEDDIPIYQPGSTVATSLIEAQAKIKHIGLLKINKMKVELQPIFLRKSHRPMLIQRIEVGELLGRGSEGRSWEEMLGEEVRRVFEEWEKEEGRSNGNGNKKLPLVRFKVEHTGVHVGKGIMQEMEKYFCKKVANPNGVFKFWKRRQAKVQAQVNDDEVLKAFRDKTFLYATNNQLESQIGNRLRSQWKKQGFKPKLCHIDQVIQNAIIRDKKPPQDAFQNLTRRVKHQIVGSACQQTSKFCRELDKQYQQTIDSHLELMKFCLGETEIEPTSPPLITGNEYEMRVNIKDRELQNSLKDREFFERYGQRMRVDNDEDEKCCAESHQVFEKGTEANFQVAFGMASEASQNSKKMKNMPVQKRKPRTKKDRPNQNKKGAQDQQDF